MADEQPGMKELLQALVQVGRIAEAMLAREETRVQSTAASRSADSSAPEPDGPRHADPSSPAAQAAPAELPSREHDRQPLLSPSDRPSEWRDRYPVRKPFFTKHAALRLHERYGVPYANMVATMAALSHQIQGTHLAGIEAVNLGQRPPSQGAAGTIWAVDIYRDVGFVVVDEADVIVTVLPRDTKQVQQLNGAQRAALETFRTELQLRYTATAGR